MASQDQISPLRYEILAALREGHTGGVAAIAFSPYGTYLATGGLDSHVSIWRLSNQKLLHVFRGSKPVLSLAWLANQESILLCGIEDGAILVLRITSLGQEAIRFWAHRFPVEHLAVKGRYLATGAQQELMVWKGERTGQTWERVAELLKPPQTSYNEGREVLVTGLHWTKSRSHSSILLVTYMHHGVLIYNPTDWSLIQAFPLNGCIAAASVSADGSRLAVSNLTGFDIYALKTMQSEGSYSHTVGDIYATPVLFVHGGNALLGGSVVGEVGLWDVTTKRKHFTLRMQETDRVLALAAHYDRVHDRFFIATGISDPDAEEAVLLWSASGSRVASVPWMLYVSVSVIVVAAALAMILKGPVGGLSGPRGDAEPTSPILVARII